MQYPPIIAGLPYAYCIKTIYRLQTSRDVAVGWDPRIAHAEIDLAACLEASAAVAERVNGEVRARTGEESVFSVVAEVMRAMAGNWALPVDVGGDEGAVGWGAEGGLDLSMVDFADEFWLSGTFP